MVKESNKKDILWYKIVAGKNEAKQQQEQEIESIWPWFLGHFPSKRKGLTTQDYISSSVTLSTILSSMVNNIYVIIML